MAFCKIVDGLAAFYHSIWFTIVCVLLILASLLLREDAPGDTDDVGAIDLHFCNRPVLQSTRDKCAEAYPHLFPVDEHKKNLPTNGEADPLPPHLQRLFDLLVDPSGILGDSVESKKAQLVRQDEGNLYGM